MHSVSTLNLLATAERTGAQASSSPDLWEVLLPGLITAVVVALLTGIVRAVVRRVRQFRPGSESPWRRSYWTARLEERIKQANEWESAITARRVDAALVQLEASEAMRWSPVPGAGFSWVVGFVSYVAGIMLVGVVEPDWLKWLSAIGFFVAGVCFQVDAITTPDRRRELQSVLAYIANSNRDGQALVVNFPQEVIASWRRCRKIVNRPESMNPYASKLGKIILRRQSMRRWVPFWIKHPWWSIGSVLGLSNYTVRMLAETTVSATRKNLAKSNRG